MPTSRCRSMIPHLPKSALKKWTTAYFVLVVISMRAFSSFISVNVPLPESLICFALENSECNCCMRCSRRAEKVWSSSSSSDAMSASSSSESMALFGRSRMAATLASILDMMGAIVVVELLYSGVKSIYRGEVRSSRPLPSKNDVIFAR